MGPIWSPQVEEIQGVDSPLQEVEVVVVEAGAGGSWRKSGGGRRRDYADERRKEESGGEGGRKCLHSSLGNETRDRETDRSSAEDQMGKDWTERN